MSELEYFLKYLTVNFQKAKDKLSKTGLAQKYFDTKSTKGQGMEWLYLAAISLSFPKISKILEIGTGKGLTIEFLSSIFPNAELITYDLPPTNKEYVKLAIRKKSIDFFNEKINKSNIKFIEKNSFFMDKLKTFDLIYLDGGHCYPAVAWDLMYSYHALNPGGFLLIHDYGRSGDVKKCIDYVNEIIPEKIRFLPFAHYTKSGEKTCWMQKELQS